MPFEEFASLGISLFSGSVRAKEQEDYQQTMGLVPKEKNLVLGRVQEFSIMSHSPTPLVLWHRVLKRGRFSLFLE